jgi:LPPG:FO 2-phospho-L-lactate transferase
VQTDEGAVTFQHYFMELGCDPAVRGFQYAGASDARIPDEVIAALHAEDLEAVILCPANPYHVIRPILEIEGMKELLLKRGAPVIAVTPIIGERALKGSAAKMMRELGRELSARSIAGEYLRVIDGFVLDSEDMALVDSVRSLGMDVVALPTIMRSIDDRVALAQEVLDFAASIRARLEAEVE